MAWENRHNQKNVSELAPVFVQYVKELFFNDIGLGGGADSVCDVKSSYKPGAFLDEDQEPRGDRFRLLFPMAGRLVKWEVLFDWYHPLEAPDFLFPDDFLQKIDMAMMEDKDFLPSLFAWDPEEPTALLKVIRELLALYRVHQAKQLEASCRAGMELMRALAVPGIEPDQFEVLTGPGDSIRKARVADKKTITFLINLPVDFSSLKADDFGERRAMLYVEFSTAADTRPTTELRFSPAAQRLLGSAALGHNCDGPLATAIPKAVAWLQGNITRQVRSCGKRADLLACIQRKLHPGLVEMDTHSFLSATFLVEVDDFNVLIGFTLSENPGQPTVRVSSVYHMDESGEPRTKLMEDFPYSTFWKPEDCTKRILEFVFRHIPDFQRECVAACL